MTNKEVMQMALETAEQIANADYRHWEELASLGDFERWARSRANHISEALRAALAQPEPEPVAWLRSVFMIEDGWDEFGFTKSSDEDVPLYTAPPQRKWVGLTYKERCELWNISSKFSPESVIMQDFAKDIESRLRELNT